MLSSVRACFVFVLLSSSTVGAQEPFFRGLKDFKGGVEGSVAFDVSMDGSVVVGVGNFLLGPDPTDFEAFRWTLDEGMIGLGDLTGGINSSWAWGVSGNGAVVVGGSVSGAGGQAFRWTSDLGMVGLGDLPAFPFFSEARAASYDGAVIVGSGHGRRGPQAVRWVGTEEPMGLGYLTAESDASDAEDVSADGRVIVGADFSALGRREAFVWTELTGMVGLGDLPGGEFDSYATAVTPDGSTIVGYGTSEKGTEAVLWTSDGDMRRLGVLSGGGVFSLAEAVSSDGSVVIGRGSTDAFQGVFIWNSETGMRNLRSVLANDLGIDMSGWFLFLARGVSGDGRTIAGWGINPQGRDEAWLAYLGPPPCPSDLNGDGLVDVVDLVVLLTNFSTRWIAIHANGDVNYDGNIDLADLALLLSDFGAACD